MIHEQEKDSGEHPSPAVGPRGSTERKRSECLTAAMGGTDEAQAGVIPCDWWWGNGESIIDMHTGPVGHVGAVGVVIQRARRGCRHSGAARPRGNGNSSLLEAADAFQIDGLEAFWTLMWRCRPRLRARRFQANAGLADVHDDDTAGSALTRGILFFREGDADLWDGVGRGSGGREALHADPLLVVHVCRSRTAVVRVGDDGQGTVLERSSRLLVVVVDGAVILGDRVQTPSSPSNHTQAQRQRADEEGQDHQGNGQVCHRGGEGDAWRLTVRPGE